LCQEPWHIIARVEIWLNAAMKNATTRVARDRNSGRGETTSRSEFVITYSACELIEARGNIILFHFTRGLSEVRNWNFRKIVYDLG